MAVVLSGQIAVERQQPWGERMRLAQTRPGDILGEMSLLDGGPRFSSCTTLTDCEIGVLSAEALDEIMAKDAALAAKLMALLARKLSFRLRAIRDRKSTRLNSSHLVISYAVFCLKKKELLSGSSRQIVS